MVEKERRFGLTETQTIRIMLADGTEPVTWDSVSSWEAGHPQDQAPVTPDELLEERHHQYYGRPWLLGRYYFDELIKFGVKPGDDVLDIGCGSGRIGVHLIPYLGKNHYCGIDYHLRSLVAFATYESFLYGLASYEPSLVWDAEFRVGGFLKTFDVVLDFYVTHHLDTALVRKAYKNIADVTRPGSKIFLAHKPTIGSDVLSHLGFIVKETHELSYPMLSLSDKPIQKLDIWHILERI